MVNNPQHTVMTRRNICTDCIFDALFASDFFYCLRHVNFVRFYTSIGTSISSFLPWSQRISRAGWGLAVWSTAAAPAERHDVSPGFVDETMRHFFTQLIRCDSRASLFHLSLFILLICFICSIYFVQFCFFRSETSPLMLHHMRPWPGGCFRVGNSFKVETSVSVIQLVGLQGIST